MSAEQPWAFPSAPVLWPQAQEPEVPFLDLGEAHVDQSSSSEARWEQSLPWAPVQWCSVVCPSWHLVTPMAVVFVFVALPELQSAWQIDRRPTRPQQLSVHPGTRFGGVSEGATLQWDPLGSARAVSPLRIHGALVLILLHHPGMIRRAAIHAMAGTSLALPLA